MDAAAAFRCRYALHTVNTTFVFELAIDALAFDQRDDFLVSSYPGRIGGHDLHAPPLRLSIARIHSENVGCKKCRFITAGARADFQDNVALIVGILRK